MKYATRGGKAFSYVEVLLSPGESVITESGAMASMDQGIDLRSSFNGGFLKALVLRFLGKESLFINRFQNKLQTPGRIYLTKNTPGEIVCKHLENEDIYIQPGAFIASSSGIKFGVRWAGISSFLGGEGLFRLRISGSGLVWYGAFGGVVEKEVNGEYVVDSGHLLSYPTDMKLKIKLAGGIFSSFFGGEGLVLKLEGQGKIQLQTRSLEGLASWLNQRFWG